MALVQLSLRHVVHRRWVTASSESQLFLLTDVSEAHLVVDCLFPRLSSASLNEIARLPCPTSPKSAPSPKPDKPSCLLAVLVPLDLSLDFFEGRCSGPSAKRSDGSEWMVDSLLNAPELGSAPPEEEAGGEEEVPVCCSEGWVSEKGLNGWIVG